MTNLTNDKQHYKDVISLDFNISLQSCSGILMLHRHLPFYFHKNPSSILIPLYTS